MSLFKFFSKKPVIDDAPFIFPYFFFPKKISLTWNGEKIFFSIEMEEEKKMISYGYFHTASKKCIGFLNFFTYFKQLSATQFIVFYRDEKEESSMVRLAFYNTNDMKEITDIPAAVNRLKENRLPFGFKSRGIALSISQSLTVGTNKVVFPEPFHIISEMILFARKKELYLFKPTDTYWSDWVLLILHPQNNEVELIALDWFNKSDADFGYVWPVRIARNPFDKQLYGQGVRMANFVLDPTGKKLVKMDGYLN